MLLFIHLHGFMGSLWFEVKTTILLTFRYTWQSSSFYCPPHYPWSEARPPARQVIWGHPPAKEGSLAWHSRVLHSQARQYFLYDNTADQTSHTRELKLGWFDYTTTTTTTTTITTTTITTTTTTTTTTTSIFFFSVSIVVVLSMENNTRNNTSS